MEDLTHDGSEDPQLYVAQIQHRPFGFRPQRWPLLQVLACKPVEDVLLALQELKEREVCLRPVLDDGRRARLEDVFASFGGGCKEAQTMISRTLCGNGPQSRPSDALNVISSKVLVVEVACLDGHV